MENNFSRCNNKEVGSFLQEREQERERERLGAGAKYLFYRKSKSKKKIVMRKKCYV